MAVFMHRPHPSALILQLDEAWTPPYFEENTHIAWLALLEHHCVALDCPLFFTLRCGTPRNTPLCGACRVQTSPDYEQLLTLMSRPGLESAVCRIYLGTTTVVNHYVLVNALDHHGDYGFNVVKQHLERVLATLTHTDTLLRSDHATLGKPVPLEAYLNTHPLGAFHP